MAIYLGSNKVTGLSVPVGDMKASVYDPDGDGVVTSAETANNVDWAKITNKPTIITAGQTGVAGSSFTSGTAKAFNSKTLEPGIYLYIATLSTEQGVKSLDMCVTNSVNKPRSRSTYKRDDTSSTTSGYPSIQSVDILSLSTETAVTTQVTLYGSASLAYKFRIFTTIIRLA